MLARFAFFGKMKKITSIFLLLSLFLTFTACNKAEPREISCEDIISAYEAAGYSVAHGAHSEVANESQLCYIRANISDAPDSDYIYFIICATKEQAEEARMTDKYNLVKWIYATLGGESRWLKTGTYGNIEYSYYNSKLIKPFKELLEHLS